MHYKNIIVYVDQSASLGKRLELAARLALHEQAHLIGLAATGNAQVNTEAAGREARMLDDAAATVRRIGPVSFEPRLVGGDAAAALQSHSLCADLVVLGQADGRRADFLEYVALNAACPVLVLPDDGRIFSLGDRILIGWNGSAAASRAVRAAMPFLRQANQVCIAVLEGTPVPPSGPPASELAAYLGRHGIHAEIVRRDAREPGAGLLAMASDLTSDLLVMGCVAHMRSREVMPGGATRVTLESAGLPVLMSH